MKKDRKDWIKIIAITVAIFQTIALFLFWGIEQGSSFYPELMPNDFDFVASVGNDSYKINTYAETYTQALDWEKDTTITLCLTREEKELIYKTITKIDIFRYPENYAPTSTISISPSPDYFISLTMEGIDRRINWTENTESTTKEAKRLRRLFDVITQQIDNHKEIKELPESKRLVW